MRPRSRMSNQARLHLCPAQKRAFDSLIAGVQVGSILRVWGGTGRGKTTVLRELHKHVGGAFLNMKEFVEASATKHPLALEETLYRLIMDALNAHSLVLVDDVHLLDLYSAGCHFYPRSG
jgi:replication-associated recombination protein RarA